MARSMHGVQQSGQNFKMDEAIHAVLLRHSTAYRAVEPGVLQELAVIAGKHGTDPGDLAAAFDRFMTINR